MTGFRLSEQHAPPPRPVTDGIVTRLDGIYEVDPELMQAHVNQQDMPLWDTRRIANNRLEYLAWMGEHLADEWVTSEDIAPSAVEPPR
jgi:hypothetical protein